MIPSSKEDADVLFSNHRPRAYRELLSIPDRGQIRIFVGGEAISPDLNLFDYAISFDQSIGGSRVFRPHTLLTFEHDASYGNLNFGQELTESDFLRRPGFCDFIYGNKLGHPLRAEIFHKLSKSFDGVNSYGRFLNNMKQSQLRTPLAAPTADWRSQKILIQRQHRFSIAAENASFRGYTSEKILTPLLAGSIPIYWGNPDVASEFNPKRFVSVDASNLDALAQHLSQLMESPQAMLKMVHQPALTPEQQVRLDENRRSFQEWFSRLLSKDLEDLRRRPRGWYPDWYSGLMSSAYERQRFSIDRVRSAIGVLAGWRRG